MSWFARFKKRNQRGAALVEAAFVLPVMLTLVFGTIEWGMVFKDSLSVTSATRSGARIASANPHNAAYMTLAASAVDSAVDALPATAPQELWIYKAGSDGAPVDNADLNTGSYANCATTRCYKYTWNSGTRTWTTVAGFAWLSTKQSACSSGSGPDAVGIYLKVSHKFITHLFDPIVGNTKTLTDHTVMRLEPIPASQICQAT